MKSGPQAFRVGLLVITCAVIFGGLVLFTLGTAFHTEQKQYQLLFSENVKGMVIGSKVNYMGIPVGAVTDISFQDGHTLVDISVDPSKAVVQPVTRARLDRLLVTGQVTVELEGYESGVEPLPDGAMVQTRGNPLSELSSNLPELLSKSDRVLSQADALLRRGNTLLGDENQQRFTQILMNLETASERLPVVAEDLMTDMRGLLADVRPLAASAERTLQRVDAGIDQATEVLGSEEMRAALIAAQQSMQQLAEVERSLLALSLEAHNLLTNNKHPLRTALLTVRDTMREFQGLARKLRMAPSSLLFGVEEPEITVPASMPPRGGR